MGTIYRCRVSCLIQERNINTGEYVEFEVSGDHIEAVYMIPGWTHNIINLSETENLVTVMTCNEIFNKDRPDTFFEIVKQGSSKGLFLIQTFNICHI